MHKVKHNLLKTKNLFPTGIQKTFYFSHGSTIQMRIGKTSLNLSLNEDTSGVSREWHLSATCHGKSAHDGLGGAAEKPKATHYHVHKGQSILRPVINPSTNPQAGGPPLASHPLLLIQSLHSYPPHHLTYVN
jgi:hypothetical protein